MLAAPKSEIFYLSTKLIQKKNYDCTETDKGLLDPCLSEHDQQKWSHFLAEKIFATVKTLIFYFQILICSYLYAYFCRNR